MRFVLPGALVCLLLISGCGSAQHVAEREDYTRTIDSLEAVNEDLRDSLSFYDDIYSGQFFRDRRVMADRIRRLEFDVMDAREGGRLVQNLAVDDLFEPASATLTEAGREAISEVADRLTNNFDGKQIRVEAHADNSPIGGALQERYPSNWELSAARASAIVRELIDAHGLPAHRLRVVSFGDARPVVPNTTAESRSLNRRVRITALPDAP